MDYKKKGRGTGPKELYAQAELTRALGTGGGKYMEEMAHNGAARQAQAESSYTIADLKSCAKTRPLPPHRVVDLLSAY